MIAIVTGANRGLGQGVSEDLAAKGHTVIMTARKLNSLEEKKNELVKKGYDVHAVELDVSDAKSVHQTTEKILAQFKRVDILVNNAGIFTDGLNEDVQTLSNTLAAAFQTNTIGPALMIKALLPQMKKNNYGRIVNVSSGMGGLNDMEGGSLAYRMSKTALNTVTKVFAIEAKGTNVLVNSVCPGWVQTDMGGAAATRKLPEGVASIVWAAGIPDDGPTGGFYRDGKSIPW